MAPLAVQRSRAGTGILSPSSGDRVVPVAFGVDDARGVTGYAGREIDRMRVGAGAGCVHQVRARLKGVKGCAVRIVGGLGEVTHSDGVAGGGVCFEKTNRIGNRSFGSRSSTLYAYGSGGTEGVGAEEVPLRSVLSLIDVVSCCGSSGMRYEIGNIGGTIRVCIPIGVYLIGSRDKVGCRPFKPVSGRVGRVVIVGSVISGKVG